MISHNKANTGELTSVNIGGKGYNTGDVKDRLVVLSKNRNGDTSNGGQPTNHNNVSRSADQSNQTQPTNIAGHNQTAQAKLLGASKSREIADFNGTPPGEAV